MSVVKKDGDQEHAYDVAISAIFFAHYEAGLNEFEFKREELGEGIKNLGDIIYSYRYRKPLPQKILATAPAGKEWIIVGAGLAKYKFVLASSSGVEPRADLVTIKIPDATPEIISLYAFSDEQALLAKLRYNRLIDIFLGIAAFSLQNHLRTTVSEMGQIEIDEVYVGLSKGGIHYIIPVQAKVGNDRIGVVQLLQDLTWCKEKYPHLIPRAIAAQFISTDKIAIFELTLEGYDLKIVEERHYQLVGAGEISLQDLENYKIRAN
jgi:hypothetical protein